ncbi:hypothetical protein FV232_19780 [Methylobacterium sp. WL30]|uniref:hypothetical protein n=1 Tax=unclassified Methylobacterium TaxID=2615210 RepID=UPI0011C88E78|nr:MULTISPECIES: hypothetical protein [unclassified Methylobacterium]TXN41413.1 hypothetical protein FV225_02685 [Methylobacterium sp. WL93]TXN49795.1 hypothetical protein FV227_14975 [Methylobacterium sp. WL119]TXN64866.1 hypothetical protein FV232_19780 [Methylobacterium sp. WL30]
MRLVRPALLMFALLTGGPASAQQQNNGVYRSAAPITPGTPVPYGDGVVLACSAPGTIRLVMQDGSPFDVYATQGTAILDDMAVRDVNAAATTATCTVTVLRRFGVR